MSWQKSSDGAATHPKLMKIDALPEADERLLNECRGFLWALSTQSAQHDTDYYVEVGTARMMGGVRWRELVEVAVRVGLLTEHEVDGLRVFKLVEDENLWHIRSRAEKEWAAQQANDVKDPAIKVHVVRRDGDQCRYCGVLTQWRGPRHHATFTLDHRVPGQAGTVATMVVACWRCNTSRSNNPQWDDDHPLRQPPAHPRYGRWAAEYLTNNGYPTRQNVLRELDDERPAPAAGADPAPSRVRPAPSQAADPAPAASRAAAADPVPDVESESTPTQPPATRGVPLSGSGTGRVGSRSGGDGQGAAQPPPSPRRARRGRRGKKRPSSPPVEICPVHALPDPCPTCDDQHAEILGEPR
ncbi:HNH endonuclease [Cellulomonas oligotrophica]|uniref:HNH nuclease domain-containing protein n=1 Tax=Cellulomonas oligotrophica TaxID=931536 RepID=A0A7Y9FI85_9CELL|nr:hypothetical protein [Cellulomonas oligotrophica]NYD87789.1 hypothetical protein [Cellulomonas oligotrophica]GIG33006.1 hypothetical protein Col01nite_21650 [Cellulomonas oligotrophica]